MPSGEVVQGGIWLESWLAAREEEIRGRRLVVLREIDPALVLPSRPVLEAAIAALLDFALATVPDGCEIYLAAARRAAPVAPLGQARLTLRWQVAGGPDRPRRGGATALRPLPGGALEHAGSEAAGELRAAFAAAGWCLDLEPASDDRELWARAEST